MANKFERAEPGYYEQLALGLSLDAESAGQAGFVSPEEARRRSMAARLAMRKRGAGLAGRPDDGDDAEDPPEQEEAEWVERYRELLNAGWPWRVACYIAWASSPRIGRWPKTQDELARGVLGLTSDRVIATWRTKNPTIDQLVADWQALPLLEHRADVFRALARSASNPDHRSNPDRKVFLEMTGDYTPKARLDIRRPGDVDDLSQWSDEELDKAARQAKGGEEPTPGPSLKGGE